MNNRMRRSLYLCSRMVLFWLMSLSGCSMKKDTFDPALGVCTSISNAPLLRSHGFDYMEESVQRFLIPLESGETFQEKLKASETAGLEIAACNSFFSGNLKCVGPDARHGEILQYAETAFRRAHSAGIKIIVFGSGTSRHIPDGYSKKEAYRQFVSLLKRMGPLAEEYHVVIALEPLRRAETNFINTVREGVNIVREIHHPNIRLLADFYHMMQEGEGPRAILNAGKYIHHCHIAEREKRTPPGVHGDDFRPYFRALKKAGYSGGISIECSWENMAEQLPGALSELKKQIQSLSQ